MLSTAKDLSHHPTPTPPSIAPATSDVVATITPDGRRRWIQPTTAGAVQVVADPDGAIVAAAFAGAGGPVIPQGPVTQLLTIDLPLSGGRTVPLRLRLRGTEFQIRVWTELLAVGSGATVTYGELAARIGRPEAARAVAGAVAANPVAVLVPCHRVVPAAGGAGGYRWGPMRKRQLLELEGAAA